jgi:flagella basal body P-ring formation protein FlgA
MLVLAHLHRRRLAVSALLTAFALAMSSTLQAEDLVLPVPRVTIYPNGLIGDEQLVERPFIARTVARATVFDRREAIVGKVARSTLLPGQPISLKAVRDPYLVTNGKSVLVVFEAGPLVITSLATAQQDGGIGDEVTLRNNDSGTVIKGIVATDGTVRVGAP